MGYRNSGYLEYASKNGVDVNKDVKDIVSYWWYAHKIDDAWAEAQVDGGFEFSDTAGDIEFDIRLLADEFKKAGITLNGEVAFLNTVDDLPGKYVVTDNVLEVLGERECMIRDASTEELLAELARRTQVEDNAKEAKDESSKVYYVKYKIDARYITKVVATSVEDALQKAEENYCDANFGEATDIDGRAIIVEDEYGNYVWEA